MTVSILIPWRDDTPHRKALWDWVRPRWETSGFELCVGVDDPGGPFNISRAFNRAADQATGDWLCCFGSDEIPDPEHVASVISEHSDRPWLGLYAARGEIDREHTLRIIATNGAVDPRLVRERRPRARTQMAIRREVWDDVGGWDEGFAGWGSDDEAVRYTLDTLYGPPPPATGTLMMFWHPKTDRSYVNANRQRLALYERAAGNPTAMRELLVAEKTGLPHVR